MTALPDSIIQNGLFCCWKYEERNERKTKVPYQPETGLGAKSNDPSSFVPYKTAVQASGYDGIGIGIFNGICAIDLDNCVSDSGYYTPVSYTHLRRTMQEPAKVPEKRWLTRRSKEGFFNGSTEEHKGYGAQTP